MTHTEVLRQAYNAALDIANDADNEFESLNADVRKNVEYIVSRSESSKAMLTVIVTLLTQKIVNPAQDIRIHFAGMDGGFAGRSIDNTYITPFMKSVSFPCMAESGWKTHSFAQAVPYDFNYSGVFNPRSAKDIFLNLVDAIERQVSKPADILLYVFVLLIKQRDNLRVELAKPHSLSIAAIVELLEKHFTANYKNVSGASRLPTLAIYAAYQCMMSQVARYNGKILCPLENHHSADFRSGRIGDIDVNNDDDTTFEGVEIKHGIQITKQLVTDAYEKFKVHNTDRYYLLTTANMSGVDLTDIKTEIARIAHIHGCQVIVNGVYSTLTYYLRLLSDTADFIDFYVENMKIDDTVKFQHKTMWNDVVSEL